MISIQKEEHIRRLINQGQTDSKIGRDTNSGHETIERIRKAMSLALACPLGRREKIIFQLIGGFPVKVVAADLRIRLEVVMAVQRYCYIHTLKGNEKKMAIVCSVCRRDIEAMYEKPPQVCKRISLRNLASHAGALYDVACNVVDLSNLGVIASPLFCGIASGASDILEEISGGIHDQKEN